MRGPWGGVVPLGGEPTVKTTGEGLLAPPARAPGCRFPPKPAEGAGRQGGLSAWGSPALPCPPTTPGPPISMGFSCRLSVLPESEAWVPNAALSSRSVRRLVLKDLQGTAVGSGTHSQGPAAGPAQLAPMAWHR